MPHSPTGPCAVCGVSTKQRCGSCAEAGVEVFLCGREHQKLVWYAHKKVCGTRPFLFPPLTHDEVGDAIENLHKATLLGPSISNMMRMVFDLNPAQVPRNIASLEHTPTSPEQSTLASAKCALVRALLWAFAEKKKTEKGLAVTSSDCPPERNHPLYIAAYAIVGGSFARGAGGGMSLDVFSDEKDRYSTFHHLLMIYSALYSRVIKYRRTTDLRQFDLGRFCAQALQQLKKKAAVVGVNTPEGEHMGETVKYLPAAGLFGVQMAM